mmetsp:Transcript_33265/g.75389  ORF Transcript_33265/g.75389 Transcript_33265/m.75389 type:complete len:255 (+) Transcript_33265:218-982(+)
MVSGHHPLLFPAGICSLHGDGDREVAVCDVALHCVTAHHHHWVWRLHRDDQHHAPVPQSPGACFSFGDGLPCERVLQRDWQEAGRLLLLKAREPGGADDPQCEHPFPPKLFQLHQVCCRKGICQQVQPAPRGLAASPAGHHLRHCLLRNVRGVHVLLWVVGSQGLRPSQLRHVRAHRRLHQELPDGILHVSDDSHNGGHWGLLSPFSSRPSAGRSLDAHRRRKHGPLPQGVRYLFLRIKHGGETGLFHRREDLQ